MEGVVEGVVDFGVEIGWEVVEEVEREESEETEEDWTEVRFCGRDLEACRMLIFDNSRKVDLGRERGCLMGGAA